MSETLVANTETALDPVLIGRSMHKHAPHIVSSSGLYLTQANGKRILDASAGAAVSCVGHNHPRVHDAIIEQLSKFTYINSLSFAHEPGEQLARLLTESTNGCLSRAYFVSSGSEAIESALKMARQYHVEKWRQDGMQGDCPRIHIIARHESYHGNTLGALGVSGHKTRRAIYEPLLSSNISHVSACNSYRGKHVGETDDAFVRRLADELEAEFQRIGPQNVCCFICEPVVGAALGCVPFVPGYLAAMKGICHKYGALIIFDEVMCGMGRCGTLHAWQFEKSVDGIADVCPDIQTIGKGLCGGYIPLAGFMTTEEVFNVLKKGSGAFANGHTFQGHALACASALEVQKIIKEDKLVENAENRGRLLGHLLRENLGNHRHVGDIRGRGLFWGIEIVKDKATKEPYELSEGVALALHELGLEHGISIYPATGSADGIRGDHLTIHPPLNVTRSDIVNIVDITSEVICSFFDKNDS